jgi:cytochrome c oxidase cbb3-type subunit 1
MSDSSLTPTSSVPAPSQAEIDASCRVPVVALFSSAAVWLLVSAVAALFASMSFHKPSMFADCMWMSYGRILPVAKTALLYGFCLPAAFGLAFWLAARLGRAEFVGRTVSTCAVVLWNVGTLLGVFGILCGGNNGYEGFEIPRYAALLLFVASVVFGYTGLVTIHNRTQKELYPSLWFIITGLLWFPWILSTAILSLDESPVRGVVQAAVAAWYLNNLQFVVLGLFGIGAALYFFPKLSGRELYSKHLALFSLLTLMLFGSWGGVGIGGPLPAWIGALSSIAAVFAVLPVLAHVDNTRRVCCWKAPEAEAKFFSFSSLMLLLAAVLAAVGAFVTQTHFTLFRAGQSALLVQGFFGLIALGGVYHVLPKVADLKLPIQGFVRTHLWLALAGVLLIAVPFLSGGWSQGAKLNDASIRFVDVAKSTLMPIRLATVGELLWALGSVLLCANVLVIKMRLFCRMRAAALEGGPAENLTKLRQAEVKP